MDIAEAVGFDRALALDNVQKIAPQADILELSARSREGLEPHHQYLARLYATLPNDHFRVKKALKLIELSLCGNE
ncbi:MAG: hypothetical protein ACLFRN_05315 [Halothece sp.]